MKKKLLLILSLILTLILIASMTSCGEDETETPTVSDGKTVTLKIYNWGEYIADGSLDEYGNPTYDTNKAFVEYFNKNLSEKYGGIKIEINYTTYATNEDMYTKISSNAGSYDIIIPSDYMIKRLADEGLLYAFGAENIENYGNISDEFKGLYYDENELYSVPYTYGMVGIIYNYTMLDPADLDENNEVIRKSWDLLWNEGYAGDYKGKILQFNNPRDAMATAMFKENININSANMEDWYRALELLKAQKPMVQAYVNDEIYNKMTSGSAAISAYYAGDYLTMLEDNEYLKFYYPDEGTNYFVDAMCIPNSSQHKDLAMEYINFMLSEEAAIANALAIGYASPNTLVKDNPDYIEKMGDGWDILYAKSPMEANANYDYDPSYYSLSDTTMYPANMQEDINALWEELKTSNSVELWVHILAGVIVGGVLAFAIYSIYIKKKRSRHYRKK